MKGGLSVQAPYFDIIRPNGLTDFIAEFDFQQSSYDKESAQKLLDYYVSKRVNKYNNQPYVDVSPIYGTENKKRILILSQVPHDDSSKHGDSIDITLLDGTDKAIIDHPSAQIIVKLHLITLDNSSIINMLNELDCLVLTQSIHLVHALETVDCVYTIISLGGFEGLLRGKEVTVLGRTFYTNLCASVIKSHTPSLSQLFYICYHAYVFIVTT